MQMWENSPTHIYTWRLPAILLHFCDQVSYAFHVQDEDIRLEVILKKSTSGLPNVGAKVKIILQFANKTNDYLFDGKKKVFLCSRECSFAAVNVTGNNEYKVSLLFCVKKNKGKRKVHRVVVHKFVNLSFAELREDGFHFADPLMEFWYE